MLSPDEREVLHQIERGLEGTDPGLARSLERLAPRHPLHLPRFLVIATIAAILVVVVAMAGSHLMVALCGMTICTATCSGYLVLLIAARLRGHSQP